MATTNQARRPRLRLREAARHTTPIQWGVYCERNDGVPGATDDWRPLIYEAVDKADALDVRKMYERDAIEYIRNVRLIRRTVTPWRAC